jgi:hypothetical protein
LSSPRADQVEAVLLHLLPQPLLVVPEELLLEAQGM